MFFSGLKLMCFLPGVDIATEYISMSDFFSLQILHTNQFSVTKHRRTVKQVTGANGLPGNQALYYLQQDT